MSGIQIRVPGKWIFSQLVRSGSLSVLVLCGLSCVTSGNLFLLFIEVSRCLVSVAWGLSLAVWRYVLDGKLHSSASLHFLKSWFLDMVTKVGREG